MGTQDVNSGSAPFQPAGRVDNADLVSIPAVMWASSFVERLQQDVEWRANGNVSVKGTAFQSRFCPDANFKNQTGGKIPTGPTGL